MTVRSFTVERPARNQVVGYGIDTTLNVTCTQQNQGRFEARVEVLFENAESSERFVIVRPVLVVIGNVEEHRALQPVTPYVVPRRPKQHRRVTEIEEGEVSCPHQTFTVANDAALILRLRLLKNLSHGKHVFPFTRSQMDFLISLPKGNRIWYWKLVGSFCRN